MEKKRIYIAGKIGDLKPEFYIPLFQQAGEEAEWLGFTQVSPLHLEHEHDKSWLSYMREDLSIMIFCDAVYAQRNWRLSPGATIEVNLALTLGIPVIYQVNFEALKNSSFQIGMLTADQIMSIQSDLRNQSHSRADLSKRPLTPAESYDPRDKLLTKSLSLYLRPASFSNISRGESFYNNFMENPCFYNYRIRHCRR